MLLTGLLFVINFKFPKPNNKQLTVLIIVVAAVVLYLLFCFNWKEYFGWNLSDLMFWKKKTKKKQNKKTKNTKKDKTKL